MADYRTAVRRDGAVGVQIDEGLRAYMNKVYTLMGVAMAITGVVAYVFGNDLYAVMRGQETMVVPEGVMVALFSGPLRWAVMFAPLVFVFAFAAMVNRMSASTAQIVFWAFAGVMGV